MWESHLHNPNVFYIILTKMKSETIPIIYEDSEIFVIHKRQGLPVQGGAGISHSVDSDLAAQVGQKIYLVHRLDKETSGLLVCAKNPAAAAKWTRIVGDKTVEKEYKALCFGAMKNPRGRICSDIVERGVKKRAETFYETESVFAIPWEELEVRSEIATEDCAEILRNENPKNSFGNCDKKACGNFTEENVGNSFESRDGRMREDSFENRDKEMNGNSAEEKFGNCDKEMRGTFAEGNFGNWFESRGKEMRGNSAEKNSVEEKSGNSFGNRSEKMCGNFVEEKFENSFESRGEKMNGNFVKEKSGNSFGNGGGTTQENSAEGNFAEEKSRNSFESRDGRMREDSFGNRSGTMNGNSAEGNSMNAFGGGLHNSCELLAKSRSFGGDVPRYISLLRLRLGTGRTHQLRIHLAGEGVPICGDDKYGDFAANRLLKKQFGIKRLCLCAFRLTVPLPGGRRTFEIEADFLRLLEALRAEK